MITTTNVEPLVLDLRGWLDRGHESLRSGALSTAAEAFRAALAIDAHDVSACQGLVSTLELLGNRQDSVGAWFALGASLERMDCFTEAVAAYRCALERKPDCLRALIGIGRTQLTLGEPEAAARYLMAALALDSRHRFAHVRLGWALHNLGRMAEAWQEFTWYHQGGGKRDLEQPAWRGESLNGRTILLWSDLALGDAVQSFRYIPLLRETTGARVILECQHTLVPLARLLSGVAEVIPTDSPLPAFDVHSPLLALHWLSQMSCSHIHAPRSYLDLPAALSSRGHRTPFSARDKNVGVVWSSERAREQQARLKSIPPSIVMPALSQVQGVRLISLQFGEPPEQALAMQRKYNVEPVLSERSTALDTADAILNLDLVVTVDTFVAHLAAALGKPVWILAPKGAAWWLSYQSADMSQWYPTMKIFRQDRFGDWQQPVWRLVDELARTL